MCGVAGIFAPGARANPAAMATMLQAIGHRGPDASGVEALADGQLVLGHRRLAIIDLSPSGQQPMAAPDGKAWVVFNGEIYNFQEIRQELESLGWIFRSHSDTEVLLVAYRQWGLDTLERFRGMFAFALWDSERRILHLVRDRFGVKPLYYSIGNGVLAFASELKALNVGGFTKRRIDPAATAEYLQYGYVSAPRSIFEDVRTVEPGTVLSFDHTLHPQLRRYWSLTELFDGPHVQPLRQELDALDEVSLLDRVEAELTTAFRYRMVADVPVGLFLSGGIDSSLVAAVLARRAGIKLRTFTIGYGRSEFDETRYARAVAERLGSDHTEFVVSSDDALQLNERLPDIADEPIGDSSLIPTLMVSQLARRHVTVALSADGADELFGGYARYQACGRFADRLRGPSRFGYLMAAESIAQLPQAWIKRAYDATRRGGPGFAGINDKLRKFVRMARSKSEFEAYDAVVSEWSRAQVNALYPSGNGTLLPDAGLCFEAPHRVSARERFMHFDAARYLPGDLLAKVDRASMAVSLEAREPCLDHVMARTAAALPMRWKIRDGRNKYVLQRILARHLPEGFFDRPKQGFSAPVADWLRGPLRAQLQDELAPECVHDIGVLDAQAVSRMVTAFLRQDRAVSAAGIWFVLQFQRWAGRWARA